MVLPLGHWREPPRPEGGSPETPGRVQPHSLLRESVTGRRASQALGLLHRYRPCFISPDEGPALRHTLLPPTTAGDRGRRQWDRAVASGSPDDTGRLSGVGPGVPPWQRAYLLRTPCSKRRVGEAGSRPLSCSPRCPPPEGCGVAGLGQPPAATTYTSCDPWLAYACS